MRKKRGKFLTLLFSMMPGAGHMYMGFMKTGLSLMCPFLLLVFFSTWLSMGSILYVSMLIWFYAFFDCINKRFVSDEEFYNLQDEYLFSMDKLLKLDGELFKRHRFFSGGILLFLGIYLVFENVITMISSYIPQEVYNIINNFIRVSPQILVGIFIIAAGLKLISGKKKESEADA